MRLRSRSGVRGSFHSRGKSLAKLMRVRTLLVGDTRGIGITLLLIALIGLLVGAKTLVPFGFQRVGHEPVVRVDLHVSAARQIAFVACALDLLAAHRVVLDAARLEFLLHLQGEFQRHGGDHLHQQLADRLVEAGAADRLANRPTGFDAHGLAHVGRPCLLAPLVVAHGHASRADGTDRQPLQQGGPFARCTALALFAVRLRVVSQTLQILLVLRPAQVAIMSIADERGPLPTAADAC